MNLRLPIAKDGIKFILISGAVVVLFAYLNYKCLMTLSIFLTLFVVYFFRDPERNIPHEEDIITSPADGKIVDIKKITKENDKEEEIMISIFLSIFNVHINRIPCSGHILDTNYNKGKFLPAYREKASELNEKNTIVIQNDNGKKVKVIQIAGLIARRIVCWVNTGDSIKKGDRFGLIRFGSRVDMFFPTNTELFIKVGDKVKGGESIVGKIL